MSPYGVLSRIRECLLNIRLLQRLLIGRALVRRLQRPGIDQRRRRRRRRRHRHRREGQTTSSKTLSQNASFKSALSSCTSESVPGMNFELLNTFRTCQNSKGTTSTMDTSAVLFLLLLLLMLLLLMMMSWLSLMSW